MVSSDSAKPRNNLLAKVHVPLPSLHAGSELERMAILPRQATAVDSSTDYGADLLLSLSFLVTTAGGLY